jgi:uncharacterized protein YoxC
MEDFAVVVQMLSNLAIIALCIFLITFVVRLRTILQTIETDVREMSNKALPIMDNLEVITDKVRNVSENIDDQVELVKDSINSVREIADNVVDLERRIQTRIEEPVLETIGTIAAVLKGVRTFFVRLRA